MNTVCPKCQKEIDPNDAFCPSCGKKVEVPGGELTSCQKVKIYLISFIFTPFGLYWFFKYFRNEDPAVRKIGNYALFITLFSLIISVVALKTYVNSISDYLGMYESSLDVYSQMGY